MLRAEGKPRLLYEITIRLENLEITEHCQQRNDRQDNQASLEKIFQEMFPEKTDDHKRHNDSHDNYDQPYNLA